MTINLKDKEHRTSRFILAFQIGNSLKLTPIIVSVILASSALGYAYAQTAQPTTPTTASHPAIPICGDHPCAPGEVYTPGGQNATKTSTNATAMSKNGTGIATPLNISANATATKVTNATSAGNMTAMTGVSANATATVPPPVTGVQPPMKQVASGTAPADVKCPSGFQLVLNKVDSRPACVTSDVMAKLIAWGWASGSS